MVGSSDFGHIPIFDGEIPHSQRLLLKSNMWNLFGWSTCPKHKIKLWCSISHHFPPFFGCVQFLSVSFRVFFFSAGLWSAELRPAAALWCCGVYLRALEGTIQESTGHLADFEADFGPFWQNFGRIYDDCCRRLLFFGLDLWLWQHPSAEKSQPGAWGVGFPNWVPKFMAVLGLKLMIICWRGQAWQISADWQSLNSKRWNSNFIGEGDDFPDLDLLGRDIPMTYHKMEETWQFLMRLGISWN